MLTSADRALSALVLLVLDVAPCIGFSPSQVPCVRRCGDARGGCGGRFPRGSKSRACTLLMARQGVNAGNQTHSTMQVTGKGSTWDGFGVATRIVKGGYHGDEWTTDPLGRSVVNPPVFHASTVTFPSVAVLREARKDHPFMGMSYGRHGNPTHYALEEAYAVLEGADNACAVASGVAAINAALLAFVKSGDHILVSDGVYDPTRSFCDKFLGKFNVACTYFDPTCTPEEFAELFLPNTRLAFLESPSSLSFELHDFPALAAVAKSHKAVVIADNTYGPTLLRPLDLGADVSINAATKYIGGHSDLMLGLIACSRDTYRPVKRSVQTLGCPPGPDDAYLCLRGMRTLQVSMPLHPRP
jgi:cystathionine beta-lyase/cystathionine gamma-synthase